MPTKATPTLPIDPLLNIDTLSNDVQMDSLPSPTHNDMELFVSPSNHGNNKINQVPTVGVDKMATTTTTSLSLDVLFMSNSQLDAFEDGQNCNDHTHLINKLDIPSDMENKSTFIGSSPIGSIVDHTQITKDIVTRSPLNIVDGDHTHFNNVESPVNQSKETLKFTYPTNTQLLKTAPPLKRPRPPGMARVSSIKKPKLADLAMSPIQLQTKTTPTAITPILSKGEQTQAFQTPLSRSRPSFKPPRPITEVSVEEETKSRDRILSNFNPNFTSTPSISTRHIPNIGINKVGGVSCGFQSGSGKDLVFSKKALDHAKSLFDGWEEEPMSCDLTVEQGGSNNVDDGEGLPLDVDWEEFSRFTQIPSISTKKGIDPSLPNNSSHHNLDTLCEVELPPTSTVTTPPAPPTSMIGFNTASGQAIHISDNALRNTTTKFTENDTPCEPINTLTTPPHQLGFTTAGGKEVKISEQALEEARSVLTTPPHQLGFTTAGGKEVKISEQALKEARSVLNTPPHRLGFTTAGGKEVKISEQALEEVRSVLTAPPHQLGFTTAGGKEVKISEQALEEARSVLTTPPHQLGFTTAGGKEVKISEQALEEARSVLTTPPHQLGFTTAGGKEVKISEQALEEARSVLTTPPHQLGFTTAGGKEVKISEQALEEARSVLTTPPHQLHFTTAGGKEANVSEQALNEARSVLTTPPHQFSFTTAGGRNILISEQALKEVRNTLTTPPHQLSFTATGNDSITISEQTLENSLTTSSCQQNNLSDNSRTLNDKDDLLTTPTTNKGIILLLLIYNTITCRTFK